MTKHILKLNALTSGFSALLLIGCASTQPVVNYSDPNSGKILCYQRHRSALAECQDFLKYEKKVSVRDLQMNQCMANKGYPNGSDTCR